MEEKKMTQDLQSPPLKEITVLDLSPNSRE